GALLERDKVQRLAAGGKTETGERSRRAHELEEATAGDAVQLHLRSSGGELSLQPTAEFRRVGILADAAPVFPARQLFRRMVEDMFHRWQPAQFSGGVTFIFSFSSKPIWRWVWPTGGVQVRLKTSSCGRRKF